jgi:hypothetical protein
MIRSFDLRDVALVAQIEHQGTPLNAELALTRQPRPLQAALGGFFSLNGRGLRTYILREENDSAKLTGLLQLRQRTNVKHGVIAYMVPSLQNDPHAADMWCHLLDHVAAQAGHLGIQHLVAEAPEDSEAIEVLQRAGYAIYLRQDILRLVRTRLTISADPIMRLSESHDEWGIQQLYCNTAPRLVQQAEGLPKVHRTGAVRGYVLEDQMEIVAYLQVRRGPEGAWFNVLIHPRAEARASQVVQFGLSLFGSNWNAPIYCGVRRYQEWLRRPMESLGFEAFGSSVVMVKHLVKLAYEPELDAIKVHALVEGPAKVVAHITEPDGIQ